FVAKSLVVFHVHGFSSTVSSDAVILVAELLKVFVEEATRRAVKQADSEDCDTIDIEHFEKILPQLLLDF
uniref:Centromere protein X n=1 Tax=Cyprinus carpio TaxID=7962 RepID=A0A8C1NGM6_CYPCA